MRRTIAATLGLIAVLAASGAWGAPAASASAPWWHVTTSTRPSTIAPGGEAIITMQAVNLGDATMSGQIVLSGLMPAHTSIQNVSFFAYPLALTGDLGPSGELAFLELCKIEGRRVECRYPEFFPALNPYESLEIRVTVKAEEGLASGEAIEGEVTGGGASTVSVKSAVTVSESPPSFGAEEFSLVPEEEKGDVDAQAGSHPFQLTTTFALNQLADPLAPPALPQNLRFQLPPGLVGNTTALPQCSDSDFRTQAEGGFVNRCPDDTAIGVAVITVAEPFNLPNPPTTVPVPLFNLTPGQGEPARFGFEFAGSPVVLDTSVRTGGDYGVTVSVDNITQLAGFLSTTVTFWGVPGAATHDQSRGWGCLAGGVRGAEAGESCTPSTESNPSPFLTLPTSCDRPFGATVEGNSWPTKPVGGAVLQLPPRSYSLHDAFGRELSLTGCNQLAFNPSIVIQPDVQTASTPSGLTARVHVPQEVNENAAGNASSNVKDIHVTLPEGVGLNPAAADGLEACSESQIGYLPGESSGGNLHFTSTLGSPFCPNASKIGTVKIKTPLLANPLDGSVYLAAQNANPFGTLVAMYIVAEDPVSGVVVKLPGEVSLNQQTGQVVTTIDNSPELPFEDAELHFFGGSRAPLSTPSHCGTYTTNATFGPWSGASSVNSQSHFEITSGPGGSPCPGTLPFAPSLSAGTTNIQAGAFTPLTTTISRNDGNQDIQAVHLQMPPGFSGMISSVTPCAEEQANEGTCGAASEVGHTTVSVGLGGEPFSVTGGRVFLTGPYQGAPFGLSIATPAKAGPYDLGKGACDCVVVRAKLEVDRHTAQVIVTTDPSGPYAIPHILQGIPLQIKHVTVTIDRGGFTFNPTNCNSLAINGSITSDEGASAPVSQPFEVANCATLKFAPKFAVSTFGKTSKKFGAGLTVKLSYPNAAQGTQADISRVKVDLPKQLPSRLTTLQKACTARTFEENPANCPDASKIGYATVTTPLLPVPLTGPAIFVSHGGEAFPSLTMVLQGYGVSVDLVGTTFISKAGITSTTFKTVPDVPFNTFTLTLPQGKYSALAANLPAKAKDSFCGQTLVMPTAFVAQNGAEIHQNTKIAVSGCPKHKAKKQHKKTVKKRKNA